MPCSTLSGITLDYCREGRGGIEGLWVLDSADNAITITGASDGAVAVTGVNAGGSALDAGLTAFESYELYKELSNFDEAGTFEQTAGTGFQTATVNAVFLKVDAEKRAEIDQLAKSRRLCLIVKDGYGQYWLIGNERGAFVASTAATSGTAWNDQNSVTITFSAISESSSLELTGVTA